MSRATLTLEKLRDLTEQAASVGSDDTVSVDIEVFEKEIRRQAFEEALKLVAEAYHGTDDGPEAATRLFKTAKAKLQEKLDQLK